MVAAATRGTAAARGGELTAMWDAFQSEILSALGHAPLVLTPPELPDNPLLHAVLRAAGRDRDSNDLAQLLRTLPTTASLRGNAAGKRALWPQLRHLRRSDPAFGKA